MNSNYKAPIRRAPVFIGGHRKSGTTLLLSLLDAHPQLGVFPEDSGFFYAYYPPYDRPEYSIQDRIRRVREFCFANIRHEYENRIIKVGLPPIDFDRMEADFASFVQKTDATAKEVLCSMMEAYVLYSPICQTDQIRHWVEKTTSSEIYADIMHQWFPHAKFIHVIRDPRDNFASLKSGWKARYHQQTDSIQRLLQTLIDRGRLGMELAKINQREWGKNQYLIIRFEDLAVDPQEVMRKIADFVGISFSQSLLIPTFFGVPWQGNNFDGKKFNAVDQGNVARWRERITPHEAQVIEFYFRSLLNEYNYPLAFSEKEAADAARRHYQWFNYAREDAIDIKKPPIPST